MSSVQRATQAPLWLDVGAEPAGEPLDGDSSYDVAIVGGGYSGLWTALYLARLDPTVRIVVLERAFCGFGASGRNGGWCVGELAGPLGAYAKRSSPSEALRQARAVFDAVDEVGRVAEEVGFDCDYHKGGTVRLARNAPQQRRQVAEIADARAEGFTEDEIRLLEPDEASSMLAATEIRSGIFFGPSAVLHPRKLVNGLVAAVTALGVTIHEGTEVESIDGSQVRTDRGTVTADVVVQATEAYTRDLPGQRRDLLPVYSLMVATEPLDAAVCDEIGLGDRPSFADDRHMVIYGQRTADDRIAFGGRGVPYLFGSRIDPTTELNLRSHELIAQTLTEMLPQLAGVEFTHRWGGVLGIPRNWLPSVRFDRAAGRGVLGGYVGEGVAAANLAGRTMAELIAGVDSDRVTLPWVGTTARRWEFEPARWIGVRGSRRLLGRADDREFATDREAKIAYRISHLLRGD